jgi:hypothetical protein
MVFELRLERNGCASKFLMDVNVLGYVPEDPFTDISVSSY